MSDLDKRAFLAFILSMILFAGFYWWYSPVMKESQERRRRIAMEKRRIADSLAALSGTEGRVPGASIEEMEPSPVDTALFAPIGAPEAAPKLVTVRSDLYEVTLSSKGGAIVSARLMRYLTDDRPVELVRAARDSIPDGLASMELVSEERRFDLSDVPFEVTVSPAERTVEDGETIVLGGRRQEVVLRFRTSGAGGAAIERFYRFEEGSYVIESGVSFPASAFPSVRKVVWSMGKGLACTEKDELDDYMNFQAALKLGQETHRKKLSSFSKKKLERFEKGTVIWLALQTKYFTAAFIPEGTPAGEAVFFGDRSRNFLSAAMEIPAFERGGMVKQNVTLYLGPLDFGILKSLGVGLEKNINMGYKLIRPVSWVILWMMIAFHKVIPNYGVVIILISVFTKILFYRLTHKSFKSMRDMQRLQPKLQALKEKFKDDRQRLSQETMKLYKEAGVNPLGGCLPMLLQAPVFIALFSVLKYTIELRQAGFIWWMDDLSRQDVLFLLPFSLPVIGRAVSVLPILMGAAMLLQTKIGGSITGGATSASQPKAFTYMLPVVFTFIFYKMPSGLVLYWLVNNVLSIAQQYYINKETTEDTEEEKKKEKTKEKRKEKAGNRRRRKVVTAKKDR